MSSLVTKWKKHQPYLYWVRSARVRGKTVLFTDRQELSDHRMVVAYRNQAKVEDMFRISKSRRPGLWWPAHHWTASNLSVHALYCFVALLLIRIVLLRLQDRHLSIGVGLLTERLRGKGGMCECRGEESGEMGSHYD